MLQTPSGFIPLIAPQAHARPQTLVCSGGKLLLREGNYALPTEAEIAALALDPARLHPLGLWQGSYWQVAWCNEGEAQLPGYQFTGLRALFGILPDEVMGIASRAVQLAEWARTHRYCGACAAPMQQAAGERAYKCSACGMVAYPRISPAMMVLIRRGKERLLAQHAQAPYKRYTALAGFLEAGESVEEAIHREVMEEVGLKVHNLQYFGSQSWPFPHSLMIAFTADYLDGDIKTDPAEISDARWFGPGDDWPELTHTVSIATRLLAAHKPG